MPTAEAIARYFLHLAVLAEEPTPVTQMQLHKLLYYAYGWCLATRDRALFPARFQAWVHGPVEVGVYPKFADYESLTVARHEALDDPSLSTEDRAIVESIWLDYGRYSAWQLREMTHAESPWKEARGATPKGAPSRAGITDEAIRSHFFALHAKECKAVGVDPADLAEGLRDSREGRVTPWEEVKAELQADIEAHKRLLERKPPSPERV